MEDGFYLLAKTECQRLKAISLFVKKGCKRIYNYESIFNTLKENKYKDVCYFGIVFKDKMLTYCEDDYKGLPWLEKKELIKLEV